MSASCKLDVRQHVEDGYRDELPDMCVIVDRSRDKALESFLERCRKKLRKAKDEVAQAMVLALLVSDACSRHMPGEQREVLLGDLLDMSASRPSATMGPQRALLFKAIADWLGSVPCTLERDVSLNVVHVGSQLPCVVDLLFDPGALYEDPSAKSQEYRRLVADAAFTGKPPVPPSARTDLAGHMPRPPWHVEPWELEIQRAQRVGRGGFGEVFQGRWDGVRVAVKEMKDNSPSHQEVMDFFLEIAILSQLNHPNIVRFWRGSVELHGQTRSLLMVTEYIKQGGLSRLLHGHGGPALPDPLTLAQALSFALDVARGVQYLHSNRILHLDLKSPNVLCAPVWTAKLCDFGLAKMKGEATYVQSTLQGVSPVWAPPEMFDQKEGLTEKADVYSFAIIFFELLTKRVPFAEISAAQLPAVKAANQLAIPSGVPADCAELIRQCCVASPAARPSMSGAQARVREIAQSHDISLLEVKPPAALLCFDDDQQRRVQDAEDEAARRLVEVDRQRAHLRNELAELHKKIEASRRRSAELSSRAESEGAEAENSEAWCEPFIQGVAGAKFRCMLCSKLFRGPEFVKMHLEAKHKEEAKRIMQDKYFDCDVSREDAMPIHHAMGTQKFEMDRV